ncbi:aromatic aminobenezylarsenical efflux permease ArsG family transporter [Ferrimonas balearica]|uniref:aromatic aminobenezylarsenical efflux permease ArsG family transporter n=1 Tax=Ferrimonas balearica TaxID=44012 RepID=UPI001F472B50|nr:aromatic aminobenezylarsenical efflux permease ArsG family transporter [Ferrimonas balearica]MBY6016428.1 sulfite exporter TauE/SafE family protein [Halomonas denitrificans]MBY6095301.1 sulfite exporter TauE/SafE family protein [Ferrimonas balearica]
MAEALLALISALWLGVLTSISPCPLAANVAAVSYLGRQVSQPHQSVAHGLAYSAGRMLSYVLLAVLLVGTTLSAPSVSAFLQSEMNRVLGPVLVLVGLVLLQVLRLPLPSWSVSERAQKRLASKGYVGSLGLGALFALSFCPTSAALFFASLLPLAMAQHSTLLVPAVYGFGTAAPVFVMALVMVFCSARIAQMFTHLTTAERWMRRIAGVLFIAIGLYYCGQYLLPLLG